MRVVALAAALVAVSAASDVAAAPPCSATAAKGAIRATKLGLFRVAGDLDVVQPVYKKTDPNCCPTGGFDHTRYHWDGTRFVVARAYRTKTFRP